MRPASGRTYSKSNIVIVRVSAQEESRTSYDYWYISEFSAMILRPLRMVNEVLA